MYEKRRAFCSRPYNIVLTYYNYTSSVVNLRLCQQNTILEIREPLWHCWFSCGYLHVIRHPVPNSYKTKPAFCIILIRYDLFVDINPTYLHISLSLVKQLSLMQGQLVLLFLVRWAKRCPLRVDSLTNNPELGEIEMLSLTNFV